MEQCRKDRSDGAPEHLICAHVIRRSRLGRCTQNDGSGVASAGRSRGAGAPNARPEGRPQESDSEALITTSADGPMRTHRERGTGVRLVLAEGATVPERAAAARSLDVPEVPVGRRNSPEHQSQRIGVFGAQNPRRRQGARGAASYVSAPRADVHTVLTDSHDSRDCSGLLSDRPLTLAPTAPPLRRLVS